jgi:putative transposase
MPRKKRLASPIGIYHWIVRGMNRKTLFHSDEDFEHFKGLLSDIGQSHKVMTHHYCLMTNHVHLLIICDALGDMARFSQLLQRKYAYYYCRRYHWRGSVFQRGYKSISIDREAYLLECARYIERNPLKGLLAVHPADYRHSSFGYYATGRPDGIVTDSPAFLALNDDVDSRRRLYAEYVCQNRLQEEMLERKVLLT